MVARPGCCFDLKGAVAEMNGRSYYGGRSPLRSGSPRGRASLSERLLAALCHISLAANIFTYVGGIGFCLLAYLLAAGRAEFLARQAAKALVAQLIVWGLIAPAWFIQLLLPGWLGGVFFWPWSLVVWFVAVLVAMFRAALCL